METVYAKGTVTDAHAAMCLWLKSLLIFRRDPKRNHGKEVQKKGKKEKKRYMFIKQRNYFKDMQMQM